MGVIIRGSNAVVIKSDGSGTGWCITNGKFPENLKAAKITAGDVQEIIIGEGGTAPSLFIEVKNDNPNEMINKVIEFLESNSGTLEDEDRHYWVKKLNDCKEELEKAGNNATIQDKIKGIIGQISISLTANVAYHGLINVFNRIFS